MLAETGIALSISVLVAAAACEVASQSSLRLGLRSGIHALVLILIPILILLLNPTLTPDPALVVWRTEDDLSDSRSWSICMHSRVDAGGHTHICCPHIEFVSHWHGGSTLGLSHHSRTLSLRF